jgi:hypothetical protein
MTPSSARVRRRTVDLSAYPDLTAIHFGRRRYWRGFDSLEAWARLEGRDLLHGRHEDAGARQPRRMPAA